MINLIVAILGMLSVNRRLGQRDFWATIILLITGPFGTVGLLLVAIMLFIDKYKGSKKVI